MRHLLLVVAAVVLALAAPALAAPLVPTSAPLAGSSFQGGDGNQASQGALIDWDALQSASRVVHNPDPNASDTTFAGGAKEGVPNAWTFETSTGGVTPGKANILDAWSAVDQPDGRTFLYLGFTRAAGTGDTFLTFELNQDARLWTNAAGAKVPCRREDDILVSYEMSGNAAEVVLHRWHTVTTDPSTGCARTGTIEASTAVRANVVAQGAINPGPISNFLPGVFGATIPGSQFGEAALDLDALLGPVFDGGCYAFGSMWMHSRSSTSYTSQMQDIVAPKPINLRTCAAEGTKFFDLNANHQRDEGEPGIPGFEIFADYDTNPQGTGNGTLDPGEPSTVSDTSGHYVLNDIRPPRGGSYTLRERFPLTRRRAVTKDWVCSFPQADTPSGFGRVGREPSCAWGPLRPEDDAHVTGKDFGNWYPAELTIRKQLEPATDGGRFDLLVNGEVVLPDAQDGSTRTLVVPPGVYTVSERAAESTDPSAYTSTVDCKLLTRRTRLRAGTAFEGVALPAGGRATCTFRNVRLGVPAIAIDKSGPVLATAGDTLHYTLAVTNPGGVAFPADQVEVTDPACDDSPELVGKGDDATPETLDHGDTWEYRCSRRTDDPGEDCALSVVTNAATASGTVDGTTVVDTSTIRTALLCPDVPPPDPPDPPDPPAPPVPPNPPVPPQPPDPTPLTPVVPGQPDRPGPVEPPGPRPPDAGHAGVAGIVSTNLPRCVTRLPRVRLHFTRVSRLTVLLDGRVIRRVRVLPLQRRVVVPGSGKLLRGRHRVAVRVRFRLGSATPPLTLTRRVRACAAALPRFTG